MDGFFNLPDSMADSTSVFTPQVTNGWNQWRKPKGSRLVYFCSVSAGGPGGDGASSASGGGGGGGGTGAMHRLLLPAWLVPETLWVLAGKGAISGGISGNSYVSVSPLFSAVNAGTYLSDVTAGGKGNAGTSSTAGTSGTSGSQTANWLWGFGSTAISLGANAGSGGNNTGTNGGGISGGNTGYLFGGCGGGGCASSGPVNGSGGGLTAPNPGWEPFVKSMSGGASGGGNGQDGVKMLKATASGMWLNSGGTGGGANSAGTGGNGGKGGYGCGGGGGGAGTIGGTGGEGGDGFIIIVAI